MAFFVTAVAFYLVVLSPWSPIRTRTSISIGNQLVTKLIEYRQLKGRYPNALSELCPRFFDVIPVPIAGSKKWIYRLTDDGFILQFGVQGGPKEDNLYPYALYDLSNGSWRFDE
jgi:hypothetical protein